MRGKPRRKRSFTLTEREREVLEAIHQGRSEKNIGDWLGMAASTVQTHILRIARKLPPYGDLKGYRRLLVFVYQNPGCVERKDEDKAA